jgi:hypothetical protein
VDGMRLGNLLAEAGVPVLVLNACQSAHAELATAPQDAAAAPTDVQTRVRAYGSLAQEVVDAGVAGVVAMRYSVYVVTAAQFIADLYAALLEGLPLGEAVTMGRKQLAAQPDREIAFTPRPLQDWVVPVVYESSPLTLFPKPSVGEQLRISVDPVQAGRERTGLAAGLPGSPDVGFYGRDETLLALDRAFDSHRVVLLHAFAGAGKTSTAVEFARWYQLTDGLQGPVLFTSFAQHTPLTRLLDQLGATFEQSLEQAGVHWFALDEPQRRQVALQLLEQMPVLWIWDNVEPIAGFPIGAPTAWSNDEQEELADFLRAIRDTKARVLLTSRRDERGWLGDLPRRVTLPPMPLAERVQLARAIADKHSRRLGDVDDWRPLLDYTHGNPLTITVLVGQALRDGLRTRAEVQEFVSCIQAGEATLADDEDAGRTRSLGASLKYGFQHGFTEPERSQLALLHLFQGAVTVQALCAMGDAELVGEPVAAVCGLDRQAGIALLDRAAEVGLLIAYRNGYYGIHPALPWYFRDLFTQAYGPANSPTALQTVRAYATAFHDLGNHFHRQYAHGQDRLDVIRTLEAEEGNLLHACHLAGKHGWWEQLLGSMQGLRTLYEHAKRSVEWARLVDEVASDLIDPATDQPLPGCEEHWGMITDYRVELATRQRDYNTAERLARQLVVWNREWAAAALATLPTALDDKQKNELHNLGSALHRLGEVLRKQGQPACTEAYREQLELDRRIGNRSAEATAAHNLGKAHSEIPELYDLDTAAYWYQYSLDLHDLGDDLGRALPASMS